VRDPRAGYLQSLNTLRDAKNIAKELGWDLYTKSSIMLGLGETEEELLGAYADLRKFDVDVMTLGQYLRPSLTHLPVERYVTPEEFKKYGDQARELGFMYVASGAMVRSSYKAAEFFIHGAVKNRKRKEIENGICTT
jgi:lipoyl synthase